MLKDAPSCTACLRVVQAGFPSFDERIRKPSIIFNTRIGGVQHCVDSSVAWPTDRKELLIAFINEVLSTVSKPTADAAYQRSFESSVKSRRCPQACANNWSQTRMVRPLPSRNGWAAFISLTRPAAYFANCSGSFNSSGGITLAARIVFPSILRLVLVLQRKQVLGQLCIAVLVLPIRTNHRIDACERL
jgi:hypothetical protein